MLRNIQNPTLKKSRNKLHLISLEKSKLINQAIYLDFYINKNLISHSKVNLPNQIRKITLLKSPHKYKRAKSQYQSKLHKLLLEFDDLNLKNNYIANFIQNVPKNVSLKILENPLFSIKERFVGFIGISNTPRASLRRLYKIPKYLYNLRKKDATDY
jgi:ribosomal protein S10